jgi:hypothetical protein
MPPSPSPRTSRSPAQETYQKRTNSFRNVLPAKSKDDELALFSDMQKVETDNFLLEPSVDFDDSMSNACKFHLPSSLYSPSFFVTYHFKVISFYPSEKLRYFPEVKLGVNIPAHGESHDLLNTDGDKNDYEWYANWIIHFMSCLKW